uniref:Protein FADD n=1 Tax=Ictalurus punctatus TaxID=7998 RepID=W5UCN1_ICTPU
MDRFKFMLLEISKQLSSENLSTMKFLCGEDIGKKKREEITSGIQLFEYLIERALIGPYDTAYLRKLLSEQEALLQLIDNYEQEQPIPTDLPNETELEKINCAIEVISEQLGRKWIKYGRKLKIAETKLEGIQEKHPRNLEEQVRELFKEWMKMHKAEAKVDELIRALRDCDLNYTADVVQMNLQKANVS